MHTRQPQSIQATLLLTRSFRLVAALTCAASILQIPTLAADPAPAAAKESAPVASGDTGTLTGRVFNAETGTYLDKARVRVAGTSLETYTNEFGEYTLRNVPAGEAGIRVTYSGQQDLRESVIVESGKTSSSDFTFNATDGNKTVMLDKFVVEATRFKNAQELAINSERTSVNIKSVIATDSLGYIKDGNIGEFVRFLPGVDVSNGSFGAGSNPDNAATVSVRGFGADSTTILIDGVPMASGATSGLTRTMQLDAVSVNNASRVEVIKVATPDMRANAPGGTINLVTRSAFELARPAYDVSVALNGNSLNEDHFGKTPGPYEPNFKTMPSIRGSASIPLSKNLGITVSASSDNKYSLTRRSTQRDWHYTSRTTLASGTAVQVQNAKGPITIANPVVDRYEINEAQWVEYRQSGAVRVDWRPIPELEIRASAQGSAFDNTGMNRRTQYRYNGGTGIKDWGTDYVTGFQRTATFNPNSLADMNVDARDRTGFTSQGTISAKYRKDLWTIEALATASESFSTAPDRANAHFSSVDGTLTAGRLDFLNIRENVVGQINIYDNAGVLVDPSLLTNWNPIMTTGFRARSSESSNRDLVKHYRLDVTRDIDFLPFPLTLKAGGLVETKSNRRWGAGADYELRYTGPNQLNADITSPYTSTAGLGYAKPQQWLDGHKIYQIYKEHPEWFSDQFISAPLNIHAPANNYQSRVNGNKGLDETATEYYAMGTARFFNNRLTIIAGARQSREDINGYNVFNNPNFAFVTNPSGTRYRDSVYTQGVRFDGSLNTAYAAGDPRRAADAILTDTALRARMAAAGVTFIPTQLELAPNGLPITDSKQNMVLSTRQRYTKAINASRTNPITPAFIADYSISENLKVQFSYTKEHRMPDLEGNDNALLVGGANFGVTEAAIPDDSVLGGRGTIKISNLNGQPEINTSYNLKLAYYPKNGSGKYTISYYYKTVDNVWQTTQLFSDSADYGTLLESIGASAQDYPNYRIDVTYPLGVRQVRKGFEVELVQNFGILAPWAKGIDGFLTYTRRPAPFQTGGETRVGWQESGPVRAKWTGGLSYSMRRFSAQAYYTFTEAGITHGNTFNVTMPDGSARVIQMWNHNNLPPEVRVQANYVINKNFTFFGTAERLFSSKTNAQISDVVSGLMPEYASYRGNNEDRGIAFALGVSASF